jgi:hypothetical protein
MIMTQKHLLMRSWSDDYDTETFVNEGKVR